MIDELHDCKCVQLKFKLSIVTTIIKSCDKIVNQSFSRINLANNTLFV